MARFSATIFGSSFVSSSSSSKRPPVPSPTAITEPASQQPRRRGPEPASLRRPRPVALAVFLGLIVCTLPHRCSGDWDGSWRKARATRYGGQDDGWNINEGS
ncbi:hypothetical protein VaNZ11_006242, partial [Volvox africanus]